MGNTKKTYSVREVASMLNISNATLRKYEKDYNLKIPRNELGNRYYTDKELNVFKQILSLKKDGANIHVIRKLLEKSISYKEQEEQSLELIAIDELTGKEFKESMSTQVSAIMIEKISELSKQYEEKLDNVKEELTNEIREEFTMQQKQIKDENQKLMNYIENKRQEKEKKSFLSKLFSKKR